jgi:hypothetical protein
MIAPRTDRRPEQRPSCRSHTGLAPLRIARAKAAAVRAAANGRPISAPKRVCRTIVPWHGQPTEASSTAVLTRRRSRYASRGNDALCSWMPLRTLDPHSHAHLCFHLVSTLSLFVCSLCVFFTLFYYSFFPFLVLFPCVELSLFLSICVCFLPFVSPPPPHPPPHFPPPRVLRSSRWSPPRPLLPPPPPVRPPPRVLPPPAWPPPPPPPPPPFCAPPPPPVGGVSAPAPPPPPPPRHATPQPHQPRGRDVSLSADGAPPRTPLDRTPRRRYTLAVTAFRNYSQVSAKQHHDRGSAPDRSAGRSHTILFSARATDGRSVFPDPAGRRLPGRPKRPRRG